MVGSDFRLLLFFFLVMVGALAVAYVGLRALGHDVRRALTPAEWRMVAKLAAAALMFYALVLKVIYAALPAEKFIYGRF
jgi:hypothetical protein